jgi:23S rRNA U2552 (ribose-2'-O)-methylase RlmE/FtsJ
MERTLGIKPPWCKGGSRFQLPTLFFAEGWKDETPPELTALKNRILPYEEQGHWELLKKMVNPYEIVYTPEDTQFHPSLAIVKPLSRSYFKMVELLETTQWIQNLPKQLPKVRTAHVAEGPGGFIQAIVDCIERSHKQLHSATAITLKPTDHRVPGWRRATTFLQKHKQIKLVYGPDGSGDIYKEENQAAFIDAVKPGVHLFTADGGFDFSMNYQIQEEQVFNLLVCSAYTGIRSLVTGGYMVMKVFDTYSSPTKILLSLLGRSFTSWSLIKPCLSRPCNSERYFVGRDFKGCTPQYISLFQELIKNSALKRYPVNAADILSQDEHEYINNLSTWSTQSQTIALQKALQIASSPTEWYTTDLPIFFKQSLQWCQTYRIPTQIREPLRIPNPVTDQMQIIPSESTSLEDAAPPQPTPGESLCPLDPSGPTYPASS